MLEDFTQALANLQECNVYRPYYFLQFIKTILR